MTEEVKNKALSEFLKNDYWKGIYEGAPEKAKQHLALSFARAEQLIPDDEDKKETEELYRQFSDEDWDYLITHTANKMGQWALKKKREKFQKN